MTSRRVLISGFALVALCAAVAAQPGGDPFQPNNQSFSVRFPLKSKEVPAEKTQTVSSDLGELKVYTAAYATSSGDVYLVSSTKFPAEIKPETHDAIYEGVRDGLKKDGEVKSEKKDATLKSDNLPMREFVIEKGKDKSKQTLRFRVLIRGDRLYQVAVVGDDKFVTGKDADAFLDSFVVTK